MTGDEYRRLRLAAALTQTDLAELLGVTKHCIQDRENGRQRITKESALALRSVTRAAPSRRPARASVPEERPE